MSDAANQPAFPPNAGWRDNDPNCRGMTLRQWYAGQALAGILANSENTAAGAEPTNSAISTNREFPNWLANASFRIADAMIAAGEQS